MNPTYDELVGLIASGGNPQAVIDFRPAGATKAQ
jgi:hypothetical protein